MGLKWFKEVICACSPGYDIAVLWQDIVPHSPAVSHTFLFNIFSIFLLCFLNIMIILVRIILPFPINFISDDSVTNFKIWETQFHYDVTCNFKNFGVQFILCKHMPYSHIMFCPERCVKLDSLLAINVSNTKIHTCMHTYTHTFTYYLHISIQYSLLHINKLVLNKCVR